MNNLEIKDLEQLAIRGLEYETIEKEKASERKALTRKHGLNPDDAKYTQDKKGQTRDIVAKELGISGKHWDRIKYIYLNNEQCSIKDYEAWKAGKLSTATLYAKLKKQQDIVGELDRILKALWDLRLNRPSSTKQIQDNLRYTLHNYPRVEEKVIFSMNEIKQVYDQYIDTSDEMLIDIIDDLENLKYKIGRK